LNRLQQLQLIGGYIFLRKDVVRPAFSAAQNSNPSPVQAHDPECTDVRSDASPSPMNAPMHWTKPETTKQQAFQPATEDQEILDLDQSTRSIDQREKDPSLHFCDEALTPEFRYYLEKEAAKLPTPPANLEAWIAACSHRRGYQRGFIKSLKIQEAQEESKVPPLRKPELSVNVNPIAYQAALSDSAATVSRSGNFVPRAIEQGSEGILAMLRAKWNTGVAGLRKSVERAIAANGLDWGIDLTADGPILCQF
jgi:hypothetical protein